MKYLLAYMIEGDAKDYHIQLSDQLAKKFNLTPVSPRIDPHLTLKTPFEAEDTNDIEKVLETFAQKERSTPITLGGFEKFDSFGNFNGKVVYMNVNAPKETHEMLRRLQDKLRNISWLSFNSVEFPITLHATLCYPKHPQQSKEILAYLSGEKVSPFSMEIDSIALLKNINGVWNPVRTFPYSS